MEQLTEEQKKILSQNVRDQWLRRRYELQFVNHIVPFVREQNVLREAIVWISNHLRPEDIFSDNKIIDAYERIKEKKET